MLRNKSYLFCLFFVVWASNAFADQRYHSANTAAERTLDKILELNDMDGKEGEAFFNFIYNKPRFYEKDSYFRRYFTQNFLKDVAEAEGRIVSESCGYYRAGEICGLDYRVLNCSQDSSDNGYSYTALHKEKTSEIIAYKWNDHSASSKQLVQYRMIKRGSLWKLDAVDCGNGWNKF